ncbi:MAG: group III truncated hemoglobin [Jejuia sp.]
MQKTDITTKADIFKLVNTFYSKVRKDEVLAPFFNDTISDWDEHVECLTTFWESSLFIKTKYYGDPLEAHVKVDKEFNQTITETHFGIWLNLWIQTIDEFYEGDYAENAKRRARKMATFIHLKIFEARI